VRKKLNKFVQELFLLSSSDELLVLQKRVYLMSQILEDLIVRVNEIETVADSAIELIIGLKSKLDEALANNDMAAIQALSDRLGVQSQELADAVLAHTPDN
jgi:hypothetical protein